MVYDVTVVGGGPAGLSAGMFAAARRLSTLIIDAQKLGGQLTYLYTTKSIYDYPGYMAIGANELGQSFVEHAREAGCELREGEEVVDIERDGLTFTVTTGRGEYEARSIILALGMGLFEPRRLDVSGELEFEGRGVHYMIADRRPFEGRRVLFIGGGDSALEMALNLVSIASEVTIAHRREQFRAMEKNVEAVLDAPIRILWNAEVKQFTGDGRLEQVVLFDNRTAEETILDADEAVIQIGLVPRIPRLREWGIETVARSIRVGQDMSTSVEGIFACGDIVAYPGKDKRISSGCGEAAAAALGAYRYVKRPYWM